MAKAIQKITLNQAENISFDKIELSQKNVRRIKNGVTIEQLAEDIALRGLLQSLNVRPIRDVDGEETGRFDAPAGGRRYKALELLIRQKRMVKTAPTPCIVNRAETTSAEEDSLAENTQREQLHPLDQFRAFKTLSDQGLDVAEVAARFFVTPTFVKQRLKLAAVSPKLLDLYEENEIRIDQLEALAVSDDHVRQEQVWDTVSRSHVREAYYIRRLLTETAVRANDRRAVYVGINAYEAAGGVVMRDLFEQDQGGWLQDPALLEQLVFEKLMADAETLKAEEGWKWVDAAIDFPYGHASGLRRFYGKQAELDAEELAHYHEVKAQHDQLDAEYAEAEDYSEETEARLEELSNELDQFNDRPYIFDPEEVAHGGAFISLGAGGELKVERGFVLPEDEPIVETDDSGASDSDHDNKGDEAVSAAGGVSVNGKPVDSEQREDEDDEICPLADRVIEDLTATRTIALRNALANDPAMAFVAALHAFVLKAFYAHSSNSCLEITMQTTTFSQTQGLGDTVWAKEIEQRHEAWGHDLPNTAVDLWDCLTALDEASRQALFAHCVSLSLNAVIQPWNRRHAAIAHAEQLVQTIGFDMVEAGWTPTVDTYLGRVTKAHILQAVREAKGEQAAQYIDHLKKPDMAREAARLLEGSGWLPEPLRRAVDEAPAEGCDNAIDGAVEDDTKKDANVEPASFQAEDVEGENVAAPQGLDEHRDLDAAE
ncbi:ParB/RepB/Spo0J family partition protein [Pseudaminobacter arsenicus]|uniref:ParB/RepB/Spo0J family partition protein n=1 Tax=Borborobacter arsenicus TaxID=1851146 RepID=A0A432V2K9_9HYPH|nr:ParB/RepB/Spo0J family partition protein [Pseudaminobacter arsenicus]RUM96338.1 ParB/RepB/Spo0J family partition protein [Pseudaminobacter arsenicus]